MAEETYPSRFIDDIPEALLVGKTRTGRSTLSRGSFGSSSASSNSNWTLPSPPRPAPVATSKFNAGTRIKHAVWGEGIVLSSRLQDGDEIVDVVFESVGIKRLAASLANLTII